MPNTQRGEQRFLSLTKLKKLERLRLDRTDRIEAIRDFGATLVSCPDPDLFHTAEELRQSGVDVKAIVNNNLSGFTFDSIPVVSFENCRKLKATTVVLVGWSQHATEFVKLGFKNIYPSEYLVRRFSKLNFNQHPASTMSFPFHEYEQIRSVDKLWSDARSRQVFRQLIEYWAGMQLSALPTQDTNMYFVKNIFEPHYAKHFVDGGAFTGDTLLDFLKHPFARNMKSYFAVEPDPGSFKNLKKAVLKLSQRSVRNKIELCSDAIGGQSGWARFDANGKSGARMTGGGKTRVRVRALDELLLTRSVSAIKLDIEGLELEALEGAQKVITKQRPFLAISAYHKIADLWRLPALIANMNLGYKFYLRHHGSFIYDTVCYAKPSRR